MPDENCALKWAKILGKRLLESGMDRKGGTLWSEDMARVAIANAIDEVTRELREALEQISPLLRAFGKGDLIEVERTLKIINATRDKYPF